MRSSSLTLQAEGAVTVAALMAAGAIDRIRAEGQALVRRGVSAADLREAAYLASLFCGFPKGVAALRELSEIPGAGAVHLDKAPADRAETRAQGETLFRAVHRTNADRQLQMLERLHPDFAETVLCEAYGRVLAREFLPLPVRELEGVAALAVLGLFPQLRAHVLGAFNTGATWTEIEDTVELATQLAGTEAAEPIDIVAELRGRSEPKTEA